jgi:uncharacterized membrane protein
VKLLLIYSATVVAFFAVDILWLGWIAKKFYRRHLGRFFSDHVNWPAAVLFYGIYIGGLLFFVVLPAADHDSLLQAVTRGALFGLVTYATYDLTNLATLKDWPVPIVVVDMIWGVVLCSLTGTLGYWVAMVVNG